MKKRLIYFILLVLVTVTTFCACSKEKEEEYAVKIGDEEISLEEALWYVVVMIDSVNEDAKEYEASTGESYWDIEYDENNTVADFLKAEAVSTIAKYEILSNEAKQSGKFDDEGFKETCKEEAKTYVESLDADLDKIGVDSDGYVKFLEKEAYRVLYHTEALALYDVDEEQIREDNPYNEDEYESKEEYEAYITQMINDEKEEKFQSEYKILEENYGIEINHKVWDKVNVEKIAGYFK